MKKLLLFLLPLLLLGCSQTASTPTSERITEFLGVKLAWTTAQVVAAGGVDSGGGYYALGDATIEMSGGVVVGVYTGAAGHTLNGVQLGYSFAQVKSLCGEPDKIDSTPLGSIYCYNKYGCYYSFNGSGQTDVIGIYSGNK